MGVEACQGKQGWGRRRCTEGVHVPGELWPDPKCLIEKAVSFCKDSGHRAGLARVAFPPHLPWLSGYHVSSEAEQVMRGAEQGFHLNSFFFIFFLKHATMLPTMIIMD